MATAQPHDIGDRLIDSGLQTPETGVRTPRYPDARRQVPERARGAVDAVLHSARPGRGRNLAHAERGMGSALTVVSMNISSPLSADATKVTGEALQATLVDLIDLSLLGKQAHWNVVGPLFKTVHEHLDEVVDTARQYSDEVAERAVALGVNPDGTAGTVAKESPLSPLGATWVPTGDAVAAVVAALDTITSRLRERIAVLDEVDLVSQDLIIEVTDAIEAHRWMFAAQLS